MNTIKLHFSSAARARANSIDGTVTAGMLCKSGRVKTWIAHVAKANPTETAQAAARRIAKAKE